ncbi:hypothetical protein Droror1_Dr00002206, partial [Drosera rotundifolia]
MPITQSQTVNMQPESSNMPFVSRSPLPSLPGDRPLRSVCMGADSAPHQAEYMAESLAVMYAI